MAGPEQASEIVRRALAEAQRFVIAPQPIRRENSQAVSAPSPENEGSGPFGAMLAALAPLAAGNAAVEQVLSRAWSSFQEFLWHEKEDAENEQRQAQEDKVAMLVQRLGILSKEGKEEWRKHIHDPQISPWLRAHRDLLDPRGADEEFQRWLNEPGYEPPGALPAPEKIVPAPWQPPGKTQAASASTQSVPSRDVNAPFDVNTTYDEASGRHVVTINGVPFAAIIAAKDTPLEINVQIVDGDPTLNVSGGLHEVVPLLPPPRGTISSEPVAYSETPALTAEQPPAPGKEPSSGEILEQRARKNYLEGTSPGERFEAAQRGRPGKYIGKLERSLQQFEQTLKLIPGARAGVPYAQVYWGEDILGNEVDRWEAFKEGTIALAEDLTSVFEPEDLIELGAGKAATGARAVEEGVAAVPDFHPNVGPPPVPVTTEASGAKAVGGELENFDRAPQFSPLEQQLREGSLFTPERPAPQIPEPHELPPKKAPASAPAEARLEKPSFAAPPQPTTIEQPIELSLSAPPEAERPGVTTIELHGPAPEAGAVAPREVGQTIETPLEFPANSPEAQLAELERQKEQLAQKLTEARETLAKQAPTAQRKEAILRNYKPSWLEREQKELESRIRGYQNAINKTGARGESLNELRRAKEAGVTNFRALQKPGNNQGLDAVFDKASGTGKVLGVDEVKSSLGTARPPSGAQAQHKAYFVDRVNYDLPASIETRQAILDGEYRAIEINSVKISDIDLRANTAKRVETLEAKMTIDEFKFLDAQRRELGRERFLRKYGLKPRKPGKL